MESRDRVAEIEDFIRYARVEWPKVRPTVAGHIARRCQKCILSEVCAPSADGQCCAVCRFVPARAERDITTRDFSRLQRDLDELLKSYSGRGAGKYDAVVLYIGGKDSTYLVYKLKKEYPGLRMLALMVDNGFASRIALENAQRAFARLDVDHTVFKPAYSLFAKTFRYALTHRSKDDPYPLVDRLDGELTFDIGRNVSAALGIPLMIIGLSGEQVEKILGLETFESPREWELRKDTLAEFHLEQLFTADEKKYWWKGSDRPAEQHPLVLYPYYAWQLGEQFIRAEVVRLGLIDVGKENPLITNNDLVPVNIAADIILLGYSGFEPGFAQLVREGKADRQEWLNVFEAAEYLTRMGGFLPRCIDDTLQRLGLTREKLGLPVARA